MENTTIESKINDAVRNGDEVVFVCYALLDKTEDQIKFALAKILEKHRKEDYFTPVYSCIKELIANANKANAKELLVREGIIDDPDDIPHVIEKVRSILNEKSLLEYGIKSKEHHLSTRVHLHVREGALSVLVINNVILHERELGHIRERIEKSSKYDSIAEIYIEEPDPYAEGMGLGLSMVVVLLKSIGIDHANFSVTTDGTGKTFARVTIPL